MRARPLSQCNIHDRNGYLGVSLPEHILSVNLHFMDTAATSWFLAESTTHEMLRVAAKEAWGGSHDVHRVAGKQARAMSVIAGYCLQ